MRENPREHTQLLDGLIDLHLSRLKGLRDINITNGEIAWSDDAEQHTPQKIDRTGKISVDCVETRTNTTAGNPVYGGRFGYVPNWDHYVNATPYTVNLLHMPYTIPLEMNQWLFHLFTPNPKVQKYIKDNIPELKAKYTSFECNRPNLIRWVLDDIDRARLEEYSGRVTGASFLIPFPDRWHSIYSRFYGRGVTRNSWGRINLGNKNDIDRHYNKFGSGCSISIGYGITYFHHHLERNGGELERLKRLNKSVKQYNSWWLNR